MATNVQFSNEQTNELKSVKVGWSWTLFFFGPVLGIPFFIRKAYPMALTMVVWNLGCIFAPEGAGMDLLIAGVGIGIAVYLGREGNKLTAQHYAKNGWSIVDPESDAAVEARARWSLA